MLEWYRAGANYETVLQDTERLVLMIARELTAGESIRYQGRTIDLSAPWSKITVSEVFRQLAGWDPGVSPEPWRFDIDLVTKVIPHLNIHRPTIIYDYPASLASLACLKPGEPGVAERAEVFMGGIEIANAYSELTDVAEQETRFRHEIEQIYQEQGRRSPLPERFLAAITRLPKCGGIALGIDRLVMLFCDAASVAEVMPFTVDDA